MESHLFEQIDQALDYTRQPLATRMRPRTLDEVCGQRHLLANGKLLRRLIEADRLYAALFYGPPGTGKTSLAQVIARQTNSTFHALNGVEASVGQFREVVEQAELRWRNQQRTTLLLIDEIHRFNKAQQDSILPHLERGVIRLIGATTHNPFFYVTPALVSRMQVFEFKVLEENDIVQLLQQALADTERGLGKYPAQCQPEALSFLAQVCNGDARQALNALELAVITTPPNQDNAIFINTEIMAESVQKRVIRYDSTGDGHYDTISAFIKAVRASEPDSALYWLGKMLQAGEDIRFIARRLVISASEDIGLADPQALPLAVACQQAVDFLGMPEARIPLAETTVYLATAAKSNASYMALEKVLADLKDQRVREVPAKLKSTAYRSAKKLGSGEGYQYAHDYPDAIAPLPTLENLPQYYHPTTRGYEKIIHERLERWKHLR